VRLVARSARLRRSHAEANPRRPRPRPSAGRAAALAGYILLPRFIPVLALAGFLAILASLSTPAASAAIWPFHSDPARYKPGDTVQFSGIVTDQPGRPIADVRVVLEATRSYFSMRELRSAEKDTRRVAASTNAAGEYNLSWPWDGYYNRFRLLVEVPVRKGREETTRVLAEVDLTPRLPAGSPVVTPLVVKDREFLDRLRDFLASIRTSDERRVYDDLGTPDKVTRVNYTAGSAAPASAEVSWWYFESGKVYRFRDGRLEQVSNFPPVRGF
jgi:hypothetical protein